MNIQEVIKKGLCLGCGICSVDPDIKSMEYSSKRGINIPVIDMNKDYKLANKICPGSGYSILSDSENLYGSGNYSLELGHVHKSYAAHSYSKEVLENASSGGVMTQILMFLLDSGVVDKVAVTKFIYTESGPRTKTFLTNNVAEVLEAQGSKYCPVDISSFLSEAANFEGKMAYVGTPCQIAGLRQIQKENQTLKDKLVLTIANFCGGYKNHNNIKKLAKRKSLVYNKISFFRFRGGGQPGSLLMSDKEGNTSEVAYPNYVGYTGYSKMLRCHLCVDATGELADISCGDAWLDKFISDKNTWSIILTRSEFASELIENMNSFKVIHVQDISSVDVIESQRRNISSKKYRQFSRFDFYKKLGYSLPFFDGGYIMDRTSMRTEFIVFSTHKIKEFIEIIGLYKIFRKIIRKKI